MGIQKYRADIRGDACENGAIPWFSKWRGGPSIAKIENCPTNDERLGRRTVYITGDADTWFSIPAACSYKGKRVVGYVTREDSNWEFRLMNSARVKLDACEASK